MVAVLALVTFTALLDRYLPLVMIDPMRHDLGLSDTGISLAQGLSFAIFYCVAGVPLGRLIDRRSRRNLLAGAVLVWTVMAVWSGLATDFTQLLIARAGVGIAEAALAPAAYSMIADCYPPRQQGRAIGLYFTSLSVGSSLSFLLGAQLFAYLLQHPVDLPLIGEVAAWRATFVLTALAGIPALMLIFTLTEPVRRSIVRTAGDAGLGTFLRGNAREVLMLYLCFGLLAFLSVIALSWGAAFYGRTFGIPVRTTGTIMGIVVLVAGILGPIAAGMFSDRFSRQREGAGRFRVPLIAAILATPALILWPIVPWIGVSFALYFVATVAFAFGTSTTGAIIQDVVPTGLRGQTVAINQITMLLASGLSPTMVALVTDNLFGDPSALRWSVALVAGVFGSAAVLASLANLRFYARLRERALHG